MFDADMRCVFISRSKPESISAGDTDAFRVVVHVVSMHLHVYTALFCRMWSTPAVYIRHHGNRAPEREGTLSVFCVMHTMSYPLVQCTICLTLIL